MRPAAERLAERTLELVNVRSESMAEAELAELVARSVPLDLAYREGETLFFRTDAGQPLVVLAGHLDTVPENGNLPGRIDGDAVHGLGAADMKGGDAVMIELAQWIAAESPALAFDVGLLFFPREEISIEHSPLPAFFDTGAIDGAALVVVLEPTDNEIHAGCLGNLNARLRFRGESAHSARPWTGVNAIDLAIEGVRPLVAVEPVDVVLDGLVFREVLSLTTIAGGIAENVIPDEVTCTVNFRYAPTRTREDAEAKLRELLAGAAEIEITGNAPAAGVAVSSPLVRRLKDAGNFAVAPKQAWTPVAQFAERGLDAVNLGPGSTRYAHRRDEQVAIAELVRTYEALRRFVTDSV